MKLEAMEEVRKEPAGTPMLFPCDPERFWERLRQMIKDEIANPAKKHCGRKYARKQTIVQN